MSDTTTTTTAATTAAATTPDARDAKIKELEAQLSKFNTPDPELGLQEKAKKQRELDDKSQADQKALEAAIRFNVGANDYLKSNASLLPKNVADIFKAAEKETYSSAIEKDAAIKAGIIQSFFEVQSNTELLTPGLKNQLDEYLKLTKNGKQDRAQAIYDSIFEPAFEMLRRTKKAEALSKGLGNGSDDAYKNKLIAGSKKHYLGEKV